MTLLASSSGQPPSTNDGRSTRVSCSGPFSRPNTRDELLKMKRPHSFYMISIFLRFLILHFQPYNLFNFSENFILDIEQKSIFQILNYKLHFSQYFENYGMKISFKLIPFFTGWAVKFWLIGFTFRIQWKSLVVLYFIDFVL